MESEKQNKGSITFTIQKSYLSVALALVIGFGGGFGLAKLFPSAGPGPAPVPQQSAPQPAAVVEVATEGRPAIGPADAPVTIVEFTDYQCPYCRQHFQQTMPQLLKEYDGQIRYVVRNFPLGGLHPFAKKAAEAAECAYDQGEFQAYHNLLFQNSQALDTDSLKAYAQDIGLDNDLFATCLDSGVKAEQVLQDFQAGESYGVRGTPTFFINGRALVGAQPFDNFKTVIDAALGK